MEPSPGSNLVKLTSRAFTWCKTLHNFFVEKFLVILGGYHRKNNKKNDNGSLKKQNKNPTSMGIRLF
jgi:hypothetical protein